MQLAANHRYCVPVLDGILSLYTAPIVEERRQPVWPQEWADQAIASPQFKRWLQSLGITGQIGKPFNGGVGRAYPIGDQIIVKFTCDNREAQAAAVLKGHDSAHAADIYGVHRVNTHNHDGRRVNLYAIVMQRLNTGVGGRVRAAGNAVYHYLDDHSGFIEDVAAVIKVVIDKYVDHKWRHDRGMHYAVSQVVRALHDVQERTGVLSQDPHGGNLAFKGRQPAFFDFGRSNLNLEHPKSDDARITTLPD